MNSIESLLDVGYISTVLVALMALRFSRVVALPNRSRSLFPAVALPPCHPTRRAQSSSPDSPIGGIGRGGGGLIAAVELS